MKVYILIKVIKIPYEGEEVSISAVSLDYHSLKQIEREEMKNSRIGIGSESWNVQEYDLLGSI